MICEGFGAGSREGGRFLPPSPASLLLLVRAPCQWEGGSSHKTQAGLPDVCGGFGEVERLWGSP